MAGKPWVDANYRFIAAYQEVNARIAQRQQALALYVTLVVSILAALVALKPGAGGNGIGLAAANSIYPERIAENRAILWMAIAASLVSLAILLLSPRWSFRPET